MAEALLEARKGLGRTSPNPPVGAVVVAGGRVVGRGWHQRAGAPHAEREALADARRQHGAGVLRGCTVVVTLEPCSTSGRTPPCTSALIEAGCGRVVFGAVDPNPEHAGRAVALLGEAGIEVRSGVRRAECEALIRGFAQVQQNGRPWVIAKLAMSLDGRLTRPPGEGMWLTGDEARGEVQLIRAECDAILTSGETVRRDDPALTIRERGLLEGREMPWRVVLSHAPESLPATARLFCDEWRERTLVRGGEDLAGVLCSLARDHGCCTVLLEAGGRLCGSFLDQRLVDEVIVFMAPLATGGEVAAVAGSGIGGRRVEVAEFRRFGDDVMLRGVLRSEPENPRPAGDP